MYYFETKKKDYSDILTEKYIYVINNYNYLINSNLDKINTFSS